MFRLLLTDGFHASGLSRLKESGLFEIELRQSDLLPEQLREKIKSVDGLIIHIQTKITRETLEAGRGSLKFIGCASVGFDHVDGKAAQEYGVTVESAPGANAGSVGDLALAFILSFARRFSECRVVFERDGWDRKALTGFALEEKTLGILGAGNTGRAIAKRAKACDMRVVAYDPKYPPGTRFPEVDEFLSSKEAVLRTADIVSVHVPRQADTLNLINVSDLGAMRAGGFLINTSRGGIVNEKAVREALDSGWLGGYGADVFDVEPLPVGHWVRRHPKVLATPHLGGATEAARTTVARTIADKTIQFFQNLKR